jgi:tRNA pseudouridine55 synthase
MFSAVKLGGKPLYKLARQGVEVERRPRRVTIFEVEVEAVELPLLTLTVRCSPGTYLRTIAHDLGTKLGCGGHLTDLVRLQSGPFTIEQAVSLDGLTPEALIPLADCLPHLPALTLTEGQRALVKDGSAILAPGPAADFPLGKLHRLLAGADLAAVAEAQPHGETVLLKPVLVI